MSNSKLVKECSISDADAEKMVDEIVGTTTSDDVARMYEESVKNFEVDTILKGKVLDIVGSNVIVDIGYKSEGIVQLTEFPSKDSIKVDDEIEVLLEQIEDESGVLVLSKQKADRLRGWENIIKNNKEGDVIRGRVFRKIKGGLLVDVGVPVFLPASQVDIRKVDEIGDLIGKEIEATILKIDEKKMNVIISRRKCLEDKRADKKTKLLSELKEGDMVKGVVKNISDFGAFIDLGGIDGLLYITDMSWGRVTHPSEIVALEQEVTVKILKIDKTLERIALGLKQLTKNPWEEVAAKYPMGSKVKGKVVNLLPYGAFVELEQGIEGLVHISEMSWTRRINHPSDVLSIGEVVEVIVLNINVEKQELSLGLKQTEANPWENAGEKYKAGATITGRVRNTTSYGAFIELPGGLDGLLHINDMSWTKKVIHPSEMVKKGDKLEVTILSVDGDKKRIALGLKQLTPNPWETTFSEKYAIGTTHIGKVPKLVSFGAFVELEKDLEGLLHLSKGSKDQTTPPELSVGDVVEVKVVKFEPQEGKIGLILLRIVEGKKTSSDKTASETPVLETTVEKGASEPAPPKAE